MEYIIISILIVFSALFSGLTLGLMGLNAYELKRKMALGDKEAERVYSVRKRGNLLLTTLLIGNVAVNATLSIYLGTVASGFIAGIIATVLIVILGEIIPQAVFSRFALSLGARITWLVKILLFIFYPVAAPIAWILDKVLGDELPTVYTKNELVKIIEEHEDANESDVDEDEERIIKGALTFSDKKVEDIMTPRTVMYAFESVRIINEQLYKEVRASGHSRFPVYEGDKDTILGILYGAHLIGSKNEGKGVKEIMSKEVRFVKETDSLDDTLDIFLESHKHLCIVNDEFGGVVGLVTLEDILEEILKTEIIDERDVHEDMREYARENK